MSVTQEASPQDDRSWRRTLLARPVRNAAVDAQREDGGLLRIRVKNEKPWFLFPPVSWLIRLRLTKTYTLDKLGAEVWDLCDGERTVESIVDEFASAHGLSFHEARASVSGYMRELVRRGALAIAM